MRALILLLLCAVLLGGCAAPEPRPEPLTREEIVRLSKAGEAPGTIIRRIEESRTLIPLSASEILRLHEAGVAPEVLDRMQQLQMEEIRRRESNRWGLCGLTPYGPVWGCPFPATPPFPYSR